MSADLSRRSAITVQQTSGARCAASRSSLPDEASTAARTTGWMNRGGLSEANTSRRTKAAASRMACVDSTRPWLRRVV